VGHLWQIGRGQLVIWCCAFQTSPDATLQASSKVTAAGGRTANTDVTLAWHSHDPWNSTTHDTNCVQLLHLPLSVVTPHLAQPLQQCIKLSLLVHVRRTTNAAAAAAAGWAYCCILPLPELLPQEENPLQSRN
jgi:hypothetical protein